MMPAYRPAPAARRLWATRRGLPLDMAPRYPEGTREYAEYAEALRLALAEWVAS